MKQITIAPLRLIKLTMDKSQTSREIPLYESVNRESVFINIALEVDCMYNDLFIELAT